MHLPANGVASAIEYPDSDGKPMSDNTKQFEWIATLKGNIDALLSQRPDVFVAGDLLWYPVEGRPDIRAAPDVLVAFGRPKGHRGSYRQWEEGDVPVTVAFEVLSPSNELPEMAAKYQFYEEHGVEEYYVYDPDEVFLEVYIRKGTALRRVRPANGFISPRLGIRFDLSTGPEMTVWRSDGARFLTFEELRLAWEEAERRAAGAEKQASRLAELTRKMLQQQITPEETEELRRLVEGPGGPAKQQG
jgi:Uma2 family endonuclease